MIESRLARLTRRQYFPDPERSIGERLDINCRKHPRWEKGECCWNASGPALEAYNSFLKDVWRSLEVECTEHPDKIGLIITVYMIGLAAATAVPTLVFVSKNRDAAREAQKIVKKNGLLKSYPGFKTALMDILPTGNLVLVTKSGVRVNINCGAEDRRVVYFDPTSPMRTIGMSIYVEDDMGSIQKATANAVTNEEGYGYLTAAHAFRAVDLTTVPLSGWDSESLTTDDSDSDYNEEEFEQLSQHSRSSSASMSSSTTNDSLEASVSQELFALQINAISNPGLSPASSETRPTFEDNASSVFVDRGMRIDRKGLQCLGHWCPSSSSTTNQDWALIHVTNERVQEALSEQHQIASSVFNGVASKPCQANVLVHTTWGSMTGSLSEVPILMRMPGSTKVAELYQFTYNGSLGVADCGSLVVDSITKEIHGHVIAGAENARTGYMMAASSTLAEVEQSGGWRLIDLSLPGSEIKGVGISASSSAGDTPTPDPETMPNPFQTDSPTTTHQLPLLQDSVTNLLFHTPPQIPPNLVALSAPTSDPSNPLTIHTQPLPAFLEPTTQTYKETFVRVNEVDEDWRRLQVFSDTPSVLTTIPESAVTSFEELSMVSTPDKQVLTTRSGENTGSYFEQTCAPGTSVREARLAFFERRFGQR